MKRNWLERGSLAAWLVWAALPLAVLGVWSVAHGWFYPALVPGQWSARGWVTIFDRASAVPQATATSFQVAAGATVLCLLVGYPAARALGLHRFPGRRIMLFLLLLPQLVPPIAYAMGVHGLFLRLGLTDTRIGLMLAHMVPCLPYVVISLTSQFSTYSVEMEEQARTLGAGPIRVFCTVTLPAIKPGLLLGVLLGFLVSWSQYLLNILIGAGSPTLSETVFAFATGSDTSMMATTAIVFILPPLLLIVLLARMGMAGSPARFQP